ncbi:unnamed protein product [Nesidiocoris tenuis]|uniref:Uncharacterized protein n=1 Tax=Nesidiocoris tenuis TaxID=355587 RepID=A0A6H5H9K3_9HEMI|nr:unnamed protein product [Nesidiocoris tenuis]
MATMVIDMSTKKVCMMYRLVPLAEDGSIMQAMGSTRSHLGQRRAYCWLTRDQPPQFTVNIIVHLNGRRI